MKHCIFYAKKKLLNLCSCDLLFAACSSTSLELVCPSHVCFCVGLILLLGLTTSVSCSYPGMRFLCGTSVVYPGGDQLSYTRRFMILLASCKLMVRTFSCGSFFGGVYHFTFLIQLGGFVVL